MEIILFTVAGIILYVVSDWILKQIEKRRGELLPQRNIAFFAIIMTLAITSFQLVQYFKAH